MFGLCRSAGVPARVNDLVFSSLKNEVAHEAAADLRIAGFRAEDGLRVFADGTEAFSDRLDEVAGPSQTVSMGCAGQVDSQGQARRGEKRKSLFVIRRSMTQVVQLVGDLVEGEVRFQDGGDLLLSRARCRSPVRRTASPSGLLLSCCHELDHAAPRIRLLRQVSGKAWNTRPQSRVVLKTPRSQRFGTVRRPAACRSAGDDRGARKRARPSGTLKMARRPTNVHSKGSASGPGCYHRVRRGRGGVARPTHHGPPRSQPSRSAS